MEIHKDTLYQRQLDILDPEKCSFKISIIGAGATGSFVALFLAKMGFSNIEIFDHDSVEEHNFPNQLFPFKCLGKNKAISVAEIVKEYTDIEIKANPVKYSEQSLGEVVISALDSMEGRKLILKECVKQKGPLLLIDPRTGPEMYQVYTCNVKIDLSVKQFKKSLHSDEEALELPCTGRSIIYSVGFVSSAIAETVKRYAMNQTYKRDRFHDLKNEFQYAD